MEFLRHDFAGDPHMVLVVGVPEAVVHHRIEERHVVDPNPPAGLFHKIRRAAHRLHAAREQDLRGPGTNHVGREHDRLEPGPAYLVHRHRADAVRKATEERRLPRRVLAEARGDHVTHEHFLDVRRHEARPIHRFRDRKAPEPDRLDVAERASVLAHRSAAGTRKNHIRQRRNPRDGCQEGAAVLSCCPVAAEPLQGPRHTVLVGRRGRPASRERPIQRSIQENRIFEEIGHLVCGARHRVEEPDQAVHPAPEDPNGGLARPGGPVDESNEVP